MTHFKKTLFYGMRGLVLLLLLSSNQISFGQTNGTINGTVLDSSGNPLIGVTILKNNSKNDGAVTDINGHFTLPAQKGDVLNFSYIGFNSKKVSLEGQSSLDITLNDNSNDLDELVVVGYGTQKKVNLTGSVATISYKDIANKPVMSTAQALAGLAPGMSVLQNSGRPGA
ncbi:MAG: carboxypeptidase-like regulatory domain-containing protein, partial [Bacteroidota bacterium]|nr:carboxypeptidase-like regulatory domain-containing protein [Bacteroidota bacterium]